jgi:hypothetical protein
MQEQMQLGIEAEPLESLASYLLALNPGLGLRAPPMRSPNPSMVLQEYQRVSDVRNKFYKEYGKTFLNSEAQGFVNEMLTSISMASGPRFTYSRVFALGFDSLCKTFLAPIKEEADREKLQDSMLIALGLSPETVRKDAEELRTIAAGSTEEAVFGTEDFKTIAATEEFKYTYQFGAGLMALMELVGEEPSDETVSRWTAELGMSSSLLKKDAAYYKSIIRKLSEMKQMMVQMEASAKRKEAAKLKEEAERAAREAEKAEAELNAKA